MGAPDHMAAVVSEVQTPATEPVPRRWIRLGMAYLALGAGALAYAPYADPFSWFAHGLWCLTGLALAVPALLSAFRSGFASVLTDHRVVFLAAFSAYFLFGAALPAF